MLSLPSSQTGLFLAPQIPPPLEGQPTLPPSPAWIHQLLPLQLKISRQDRLEKMRQTATGPIHGMEFAYQVSHHQNMHTLAHALRPEAFTSVTLQR